jgi:hypothetical protein
VAREQAVGVADLYDGRREGRGSPKGFSVAEGIDGREKMAASQSRGHRRGLSGWGRSTRWHGTWGGAETVRGGLERAVRYGSVRPERNSGGGAEE